MKMQYFSLGETVQETINIPTLVSLSSRANRCLPVLCTDRQLTNLD